LAKKEASKILIEPSSRVVQALRLAMLDVGSDELVRRTGSSLVLMERWINGKEWIPLGVVREACEMNRSRQDIPSYSTVLSECTAGAQFKITVKEQVERMTAPTDAKLDKAEISAERSRSEKSSTTATRPGASRQIANVTIALFIVPLLGAIVGFLARGPEGAVVGTILSFVVVTVSTFLLLLPRKTRKA